MPIGRVNIVSKSVVSSPTTPSNYYSAILGQFERGEDRPVLVTSAGDFLEKYTLNGVIPEQAANRSAYYSALQVLTQTNKLWVRRVVPDTARHAGAYFAQETTPYEIDLDDNGVALDADYIQITGSNISMASTGDRVTVYGEDIPKGLVQGQKYFVGRMSFEGGVSIGFFETIEDAYELRNPVELEDLGNGTLTLVLSETSAWTTLDEQGSVNGTDSGFEDPEDISVIGNNAFMVYMKDKGSCGNGIGITTEVKREDEAGIKCSARVDIVSGAFPVSETWNITVPDALTALPVRVVPIGAATLPVISGGTATLSSDTTYYAFSDTPGKMKLATNLADALADPPVAITYSSSGTGSMLVGFVGNSATALSVNGSDDTITLTTPANIATGTPVILSGTSVPSPTSQGSVYYVINVAADKISLAHSLSNAINEISINLAALENPSFKILCTLLGEDEIDRKTKVSDTNETITVTEDYATGTAIRFTLPSVVEEGGLPLCAGGVTLDTDTTYYVVRASATTIKIATSYANAQAGTTVGFDGNADGDELNFGIVPIHMVEGVWTGSQVLTIDLEGDIDYDTNTIRLKQHSSAYQNWVAGEAVRVYSTGSGSVLPYGLNPSSKYYLLPVGNGAVKLCTLSGSILDNVTRLSEVNLVADTGRSGAGYFTMVSAVDSIPANCFRVKVWKSANSGVTLQETFVCSLSTTLSDSGGRSYLVSNRLNSSNYVGAIAAENPSGTLSVKVSPFITYLGGGINDDTEENTGTVTSADLIRAVSDFSDTVQYPLSYLMDGGLTFPDFQVALVGLAEARQDCVVNLSTPQSLEYEPTPYRAIEDYVNANLPNSSFYAVYTPWQLYTDSNGTEITIPPDGFVTAQDIKIDNSFGAHEAVSGMTNGAIASRGGRIVFNSSELDSLYDNGINPILNIEGSGATIWGNKTGLAEDSPLSRKNIRKQVNEIQKDLKKKFLNRLGSVISDQTRSLITNEAIAYLRNKKGVKEFEVICDGTNNTSEDEDNQTINVFIFVKFYNTIEFINVMAIVTPSSVSFDTVLVA